MTRPRWTSISPIRYPTMPGVSADVSGSETRDESSSSVGRTIVDRACLPAGHQALQSGRNGLALLQRHLELTTRRGAVCSQYRRCGARNQRKHHGRAGSDGQARLDRRRIFLISQNQVRVPVLQRVVEVVIVVDDLDGMPVPLKSKTQPDAVVEVAQFRVRPRVKHDPSNIVLRVNPRERHPAAQAHDFIAACLCGCCRYQPQRERQKGSRNSSAHRRFFLILLSGAYSVQNGAATVPFPVAPKQFTQISRKTGEDSCNSVPRFLALCLPVTGIPSRLSGEPYDTSTTTTPQGNSLFGYHSAGQCGRTSGWRQCDHGLEQHYDRHRSRR